MAKQLHKHKITTLIHFILDKSGSMQSIKEATIKGFNEYVKELKQSKEDIEFSLTLFDTHSIEKRFTQVPVREVPELTDATYRPAGGTPLYDAVVDSVEELNSKIGDNKDIATVVVIMTDGEENSSTKHTQKCMKELVAKLEKKKNWTFTYMGANQDAWVNASNMGISIGNTMSWESTVKGTSDAFRGVAMASMNYAAYAGGGGAGGGDLGTTGFFSGGDKDVTQS